MTSKRKILFLAANPKGTSKLWLEEELRDIEEGLQRATQRDQFALKQRWAVRPRDIRRALLNEQPSIVHFSGHGVGASGGDMDREVMRYIGIEDKGDREGLIFENQLGEPVLVSGESLAGLFELFSDQVDCVVLNGCFSEMQAKAIAQHIPYVIGMNRMIGDRAAIEFAVGFYDALAAGRDIEFAHRMGCSAIHMEGIEEHLTPVLFFGDAQPVSQSELRSESGTEPRQQRESSDIESPFIVGPPITNPRQFFGRERELRRLFNLIKRLPLQNAAIIGPRRSGKTSLLYYLMSICTAPETELRPGQRNDWLPNGLQYCWVYVDFQDVRVQSRLGLMTHLLKGMGMAWQEETEPSLEQFMDVVIEGLKQPTVVLMDEVGVGLARCPELDDSFWESLRALATTQTNGILGFVLATNENPMELAQRNGHSSPFFNIFGFTSYVGPLELHESNQLIEHTPVDFLDGDLQWLLSEVQQWPLFIQLGCWEYSNCNDEVDRTTWKSNLLSYIKNYPELLQK